MALEEGECCVCYCHISAGNEGQHCIQCRQGHKTCLDCIKVQVRSAVNDPNTSTALARDGALTCAECQEAIPEIPVLRLLTCQEPDLIQRYLDIRREIARREGRHEAAHAANTHAVGHGGNHGDDNNVNIGVLRMDCIEAVLTLTCSSCQTAFFDFDGCCALTCAQPQCRRHFCALCLQVFPTDDECHRHVTECDFSAGQRMFFLPPQDIVRAQNELRLCRLVYFVQQHRLSPEQANELVQSLRREFEDLGMAHMAAAVMSRLHMIPSQVERGAFDAKAIRRVIQPYFDLAPLPQHARPRRRNYRQQQQEEEEAHGQQGRLRQRHQQQEQQHEQEQHEQQEQQQQEQQQRRDAPTWLQQLIQAIGLGRVFQAVEAHEDMLRFWALPVLYAAQLRSFEFSWVSIPFLCMLPCSVLADCTRNTGAFRRVTHLLSLFLANNMLVLLVTVVAAQTLILLGPCSMETTLLADALLTNAMVATLWQPAVTTLRVATAFKLISFFCTFNSAHSLTTVLVLELPLQLGVALLLVWQMLQDNPRNRSFSQCFGPPSLRRNALCALALLVAGQLSMTWATFACSLAPVVARVINTPEHQPLL